jgi:GTP-binding protein EngB required for normal cell division
LVVERQDTKLATQYETLRRREYELITQLLDVLPKIDGLEEDRVTQMRDALFHADSPYLMVLMGPFNSGKSSIINAMLGDDDLLPIGPVPTTDRITMLRYGDEAQRVRSGEVDTVFYPSPLLQKVSFVDTPGLESVFQTHEEQTRRFLHRSDAVLLVMLATQAMTARNMEYLQILKDYGKTVIIILNQIDLLSPEEAETVRAYVLEQSRDFLGYKPEVWMISARRGLEARHEDGMVDEEMWAASGLSQIEDYVDRQLGDAARMRQKLQTPLQIMQNVHQTALAAVRGNQSALDQYQSISQNVERQLSGFQREQDKIVRELTEEAAEKFDETADRGSAAIRDMFRLTQAFRSVMRGFGELTGLSRISRRGGSYTRNAFEVRKVFEPLDELPIVVGRLGPRLEGKDVQDVEALVKYARREIDALPSGIKTKVIGTVQAPAQYDRKALQDIREDLETIESEARVFETERLERIVRNSLLYLAAYEVLVLVLMVFALAVVTPPPDQPLLPVGIILIFVGLALLGLAYLPLRGRILATAYANRLTRLQNRYLEVLTKAAQEQVAYGMQLRRDAVLPLTRLIDAQTQIQQEQLGKLQAAGQEMVKIEAELGKVR